MTTDTLFNTREEWLTEAITECRAIFANENAGDIPAGVKVSCGFPLSAKRAKHTSIGECWAPAASAANVYEILISPTVSDAREVMAILVHELAHIKRGDVMVNVVHEIGHHFRCFPEFLVTRVNDLELLTQFFVDQ